MLIISLVYIMRPISCLKKSMMHLKVVESANLRNSMLNLRIRLSQIFLYFYKKKSMYRYICHIMTNNISRKVNKIHSTQFKKKIV